MTIERILQTGYLPVCPSDVGEGAQLVNEQWYMPRWGCDTLQHIAELEEGARRQELIPKTKKLIQSEAWAAIRLDKNSGREWLDRESVGYDRESTVKKTESCDNTIPHWAVNNPVVRIVEVVIKEKVDDRRRIED